MTQPQKVFVQDLGRMDYQRAWDYQDHLLRENLRVKAARLENPDNDGFLDKETRHHLLFVEHSPVFTLGKSGHPEHVLLNEEEMEKRGISFFRTNRGGDITFHGPGQVVGYPILDLEKFSTDIGKYLRNLEEVIILTLKAWGIEGQRSPGETGVWLEQGKTGTARKICAMGVRCSRWVTMHGFALNVNTELSYFNHIIPCGIPDKGVTSMAKELGKYIEEDFVKREIQKNFGKVFEVEMILAANPILPESDA
jgi:lipoyl(octanoyl) transferase